LSISASSLPTGSRASALEAAIAYIAGSSFLNLPVFFNALTIFSSLEDKSRSRRSVNLIIINYF
jgi:hypothetical protein